MEEISIVDYETGMLDDLIQLFYDTVHTINARDYKAVQLDRWAPEVADQVSWQQRLKNNLCKVAVVNGVVAGFAELTTDAHIDTMYVHKDYQGRGIAGKLMEALLTIATNRQYDALTTESSITAKPLFERFGFVVTKTKRKLHNGKPFINYKMIKEL